jgi:uncharacterized membrane protein YccF (DUF307 family)
MANTNSFSPNIIIRALWFILLGWGLTGLWLAIAWILNVSVIFLPIGLKMISLTPKVLTLKDIHRKQQIVDGNLTYTKTNQTNILFRGLYFLFVGWWASLLWMSIGYQLCITLIGLPYGIWMLNRLPEVTTLYRS